MEKGQTKDLSNLLVRIKKAVASGNYRVTRHALQRQTQRGISLQDALYVLTHGRHEEEKTTFDNAFQTWKYAMRGRTCDGVDVRVIVAFHDEMIIITVIRVTR